MPSTIWSGAISFGLVTIPCKVVGATEDHSIRFHQVHLEDMGRVRTRKVCEIDGEVVTQDEIGKGYEFTQDETVPITDAELDQTPLPTAKAIEIVAFVDADTIDPVRIGDSYYLAADGQVAAKPYILLRKALERSDKVAIAKFAWHNRERLGLLRVRDNAVVLHAMRWPDEIRDPAELAPKKTEVDEGEIEQAVQLAESMTIDDISGFRDAYRDALEELIEARSEGEEPAQLAEGEAQQPAQVVDLMAALNASVQRSRESRGETDDHATVHEMKPRKEASAKKTAKKAPAKKAAAKKTTGEEGDWPEASQRLTARARTAPRPEETADSSDSPTCMGLGPA